MTNQTTTTTFHAPRDPRLEFVLSYDADAYTFIARAARIVTEGGTYCPRCLRRNARCEQSGFCFYR